MPPPMLASQPPQVNIRQMHINLFGRRCTANLAADNAKIAAVGAVWIILLLSTMLIPRLLGHGIWWSAAPCRIWGSLLAWMLCAWRLIGKGHSSKRHARPLLCCDGLGTDVFFLTSCPCLQQACMQERGRIRPRFLALECTSPDTQGLLICHVQGRTACTWRRQQRRWSARRARSPSQGEATQAPNAHVFDSCT